MGKRDELSKIYCEELKGDGFRLTNLAKVDDTGFLIWAMLRLQRWRREVCKKKGRQLNLGYRLKVVRWLEKLGINMDENNKHILEMQEIHEHVNSFSRGPKGLGIG